VLSAAKGLPKGMRGRWTKLQASLTETAAGQHLIAQDTGHAIHQERPEQVTTTVIDVVKQSGSREHRPATASTVTARPPITRSPRPCQLPGQIRPDTSSNPASALSAPHCPICARDPPRASGTGMAPITSLSARRDANSRSRSATAPTGRDVSRSAPSAETGMAGGQGESQTAGRGLPSSGRALRTPAAGGLQADTSHARALVCTAHDPGGAPAVGPR
jgi:hypothetical protein